MRARAEATIVRHARHFQVIERQHAPGSTTSVSAILRRDGAPVGGKRRVARFVQGLAGANGLRPHHGIGVVQHLARQRRVEAAQPLERPQRVNAGERRSSSARTSASSAGATDWSCFRTSSCCAVSRHQPFAMRQVPHQLRGAFLQHARPGAVRRHAVVGQPPDAPMAEHFVQLVLLDLLPEVGAFLGPRRPFDHAAIHVGDVDRAVGRVRDADRAEQRVERADELAPRVHVAKLRQAFGLHRPQPPHRPRHRLAVQVVAEQIRRQPVTAIDRVSRRGSRIDDGAIRHARAGQLPPARRQ